MTENNNPADSPAQSPTSGNNREQTVAGDTHNEAQVLPCYCHNVDIGDVIDGKHKICGGRKEITVKKTRSAQK